MSSVPGAKTFSQILLEIIRRPPNELCVYPKITAVMAQRTRINGEAVPVRLCEYCRSWHELWSFPDWQKDEAVIKSNEEFWVMVACT